MVLRSMGEGRSLSGAADVSARAERIRSLRAVAGAGGYRKPGAACATAQGRVIHPQPPRARELQAIKAWLVERQKLRPPCPCFLWIL
ncbi:MAG: hypothetical protein WCD18_15370 [Thermosynechococcaceae cyanobacterium]